MVENKKHFQHIMFFYFRKGKNASHISFSASAFFYLTPKTELLHQPNTYSSMSNVVFSLFIIILKYKS